ncbi:hypothetical protein CGLO_05734 [Colletotrichum gloeosporioides Cg-14]|uniref:Uncharacterized protein n=1 Tax=Colletotrichum gloeosporioides (strain Cg-14) TaxID=1237896 RepID=T0M109_COLGC|nr:hypothetical protein CGLO_05734 [Colletotrichum gloeosporioides Cg-14]
MFRIIWQASYYMELLAIAGLPGRSSDLRHRKPLDQKPLQHYSTLNAINIGKHGGDGKVKDASKVLLDSAISSFLPSYLKPPVSKILLT